MATVIIEPKTLNLTSHHTNQDSISITIPQEVAHGETRECPICYDSIHINSFLTPLNCDHGFCKACLSEHLKSQISSFNVLNIPCPFSGCSEVFTEKIIQPLLDQSTFETYQAFVLKKVMAKDLDVKFCPKPGCSRSFKPSQNSAYTTCSCHTKICNICCHFWHEGKTCLEAIDPAYKLFAREQDIKFCMMCKSQVQKVEGCKHITCPICDYEWCWDCGRQYSKGHQQDCLREWAPLPPVLSDSMRFKMYWHSSSALKKILLVFLAVICSPLILLGCILFWPLYYFFNPRTDLSIERPGKSVGIIALSVFLGLVLTPLLIVPGIIVGFTYLMFLPFSLIFDSNSTTGAQPESPDLPRNTTARTSKKNKDRWLTGNANKFVYTGKAKPGTTHQEELQHDLEMQTIPERASSGAQMKAGLFMMTVDVRLY